MSDLDRVVDLLSSFIPEAKVLEFLEKESEVWEGRCILDMIKEGRTDEVLERLSDALYN